MTEANLTTVANTATSFAHLIRLSDDTGLFEHARHAVVRREHGYCTDDVARGLLVACREPDPPPAVLRLAGTYLAFLTHAQDHTGAFRNRLSFDRRWTDEPDLGDWWGRALWGLGTAAARGPAGWIRTDALVAFTLGAARRSPATRAMAFAGLGAAEVLRAYPGHGGAAALLGDAAAAIGKPADDPAWPWPQRHLSYANAVFAEVLIAAGELRDDHPLRSVGLRMLAWLRDLQTDAGHLSVVPVAGWRADDARPAGRDPAWPRHDQQPIEVAALADAGATAYAATGDAGWADTVRLAAAWFAGDNDGGVPMWDQETDGGYDGLTADGPNLNQGAESTLALISTMQQNRRLPRR